MKISYNWLRDYLQTDLKVEKIGEILTDIGLEVEGIEKFETLKGGLEGIVVGKVISCEPHPNADKLKITQVDISQGAPLTIVCGAPNVAKDQKVAVATVGTVLYDKNGGSFQIKEAKIRGEKSSGMLCSQAELGIGEDSSGIWLLEDEKFEVGSPLNEYFESYDDSVFEIGLTPNRTDAMSHYGVARDLHAYLQSNSIASTFEKVSSQSVEGDSEIPFKVTVEQPEMAPRYVGAIMNNIVVEESPEWLQNRLRSIGLEPINNVVDITNYILHSLGQPLHAFDLAVIKGNEIRVGSVDKSTEFVTLDGIKRELNGTEIVIKDAENTPLCIAGVFGGANSGVQTTTTSIFLESAYFDPVLVRKGAKYHGLNTDASFRFERGVDPQMTKLALSYAIKLIEEVCGGVLQGDLLEHYPEPIEGAYVVLRYSMLDQILGIKIHREKVKEILRSLEIEILNEIQNGLELRVPTFKADVTREIDVIEEILRIYGYNKVESPSKFSFSPVSLSLVDLQVLEDHWARALQSNGFSEVMNNSLRQVSDTSEAVALLNPLSGELAHMRISLMDGMLDNASFNINRKRSDLKLFELGNIYHKRKKYEERKQLAVLITGNDQKESWLYKSQPTHFYHLKTVVEMLLSRLGLSYNEVPLQDDRFSESIAIQVGSQVVARIGKVSGSSLKRADIDQPCFYAELELELLHNLRKEVKVQFKELPKFNIVRRDLALLLDKNQLYKDLIEAVWEKPSPYLRKVGLFDVYEGEKLPEGKKSYALSFELLSEEKTLDEKEISEVMNGLIKLFEKKFEAQIR